MADLCRQRQQYWWQGFQIQRHFQGRFADLAALIEAGLIVATHSLTHREVVPAAEAPHLIFAFTPALAGP